MTLDEALEVLVREHIGDFVYTIRDRCTGDPAFTGGTTWDHPRVKAWSDACQVIARHVEQRRRKADADRSPAGKEGDP